MSATPVTPDEISDMSDWPGSPLSTLHGAEAGALPVPVEEFPSGDRYLVRFELPGIDPAKNLEVSVEAQILTVHAERPPVTATHCHSQFSYGSFCSHVTLPAEADTADITAAYQDGILEVSVGFAARPQARKIEVATDREES